MKILFWGGTKGNSGPCNVNKEIVKNLTSAYWTVTSSNKYLQLLEGLVKCLFSDVVVVSGVSRHGMIFVEFAKRMGIKSAYIMHGCGEYEVVVNRQKNCELGLKQERIILQKADLLLPVSKKFRDWVCDRYPHYAEKTDYLYNGINKSILGRSRTNKKIKGSIAATGADRGVKNNIIVAKAVEELGGKAKLTVYGAIYHGIPRDFAHTRYTGVVPHKEYIRKLEETELFVVNSTLETFSISLIEALCCGCGILTSEFVGAVDLLELEECDIIHNPMNVQEVREKIEYLLEHPNNERIMSKLDLDKYSYEKSVERLTELCKELIAK